MQIRPATPSDADGIAAVLEAVTAERIHSAIERAWSVEEERRFLAALGPREAVHVACDATGQILGFQILDLWSPYLTSMSHVGQLGTYILPAWRGAGIGKALWAATESFARQAGYRKLVIQVRASNTAAQAYYASLGFVPCGRLTAQAIIDGVEDDEVLMELLFSLTA